MSWSWSICSSILLLLNELNKLRFAIRFNVRQPTRKNFPDRKTRNAIKHKWRTLHYGLGETFVFQKPIALFPSPPPMMLQNHDLLRLSIYKMSFCLWSVFILQSVCVWPFSPKWSINYWLGSITPDKMDKTNPHSILDMQHFWFIFFIITKLDVETECMLMISTLDLLTS